MKTDCQIHCDLDIQQYNMIYLDPRYTQIIIYIYVQCVRIRLYIIYNIYIYMYAKNSPQILCVLKTTQQGLFRRSMAPNKPMTKGMQVVFHSTSFVTTSCVCFFSIRRCFEEVK